MKFMVQEAAFFAENAGKERDISLQLSTVAFGDQIEPGDFERVRVKLSREPTIATPAAPPESEGMGEWGDFGGSHFTDAVSMAEETTQRDRVKPKGATLPEDDERRDQWLQEQLSSVPGLMHLTTGSLQGSAEWQCIRPPGVLWGAIPSLGPVVHDEYLYDRWRSFKDEDVLVGISDTLQLWRRDEHTSLQIHGDRIEVPWEVREL